MARTVHDDMYAPLVSFHPIAGCSQMIYIGETKSRGLLVVIATRLASTMPFRDTPSYLLRSFLLV